MRKELPKMEQILVVEGNQRLHTAIEGVLRGEGTTVPAASSRVQALQLMEEGHPDMILSDSHKPRMGG